MNIVIFERKSAVQLGLTNRSSISYIVCRTYTRGESEEVTDAFARWQVDESTR